MKRNIFIFIFLTIRLFGQSNSSYEFIQNVNNNVVVNWTRGMIYSEYTMTQNENSDKKNLEKMAYYHAYHQMILALLELYYTSGKKLKDVLKIDTNLQRKFHQIEDKIRIEKKIIYLNRITYLLSFDFLNYLNENKEINIEELENSYTLPIRKEKQFNGIIIYVPQKKFIPSMEIKIYSSNGKFIMNLPIKKNFYFSNDSIIYKDKNLIQPYIIYTENIMNSNEIIIEQNDIQFLVATNKIFGVDNIKFIIYEESQ